MSKMRQAWYRGLLFLLAYGLYFASSDRVQGAFTYTNNNPALNVVPYGSSFTYSVTWSGGNYGNSGTTRLNTFSRPSTFHSYNVNYPSNYTFEYTISGVSSVDDGSYSLQLYGTNNINVFLNTPPIVIRISPAILTQPTDTTCLSGTTTSMGISAGPSTATFQWIDAASGIVLATGSSFTATSSMNGRRVYCRIFNQYGTASSSSALLQVGAAPNITTQPVTTSVPVGGSATLSVNALGASPLYYQWYHNGISIPGADQRYLTFSPAALTDAGTYSVAVSNSYGITNSSVVTLNVGVSPAITHQPGHLVVTQGQSAAFSVAATGSAPLRYLWRKNGASVVGATNQTLNFTTAALSDAADYTCQVSNDIGSVTSAAATLTVYGQPSITAQPTNTIVGVGSNFTMTVTALGTPSPVFQWIKDGSILLGYTNDSFTIAIAQITNSGAYSVVITNQFGSVTSSVANVTVLYYPPVITVQPVSRSVAASSNATLSVTAVGSPALAYQWYKSLPTVAAAIPVVSNRFFLGAIVSDGGSGYTAAPAVAIIGGGGNGAAATAVVSNGAVTQIDVLSTGSGYTNVAGIQIQIDPPTIALNGETNSVLNIVGATANDAAVYHVMITNLVGMVTSSNATLSVNVPIYITQDPQDQTVAVGDSAMFSVQVDGTPPFRYQWHALPASNYTATATALIFDGFVYGTTITSGGAGYTTAPKVQFVGGGGSGASATTVVSNRSLIAINVTSTGSGYTSLPTIQIDPPTISLSGKSNAVLSISAATTNDAGSYFVMVTNSYGNVTSKWATLTIGSGAAPQITSDPASQNVLVGSPASFDVAATGPALAYQWQKNGFDLPAANSTTYTIQTTTTNDSGNYRTIITNANGSVTSSVARLTVGLPPQTLSVNTGAGEGIHLQMTGTPDYPYVLESATNLMPPVVWQSLLTNNADSNGVWSFTDTNTASFQQRYYRVMGK
jgi:hypothetical protein